MCDNWPTKLNSLVQFLQKRLEGVTNEGLVQWYLSVSYMFNEDSSAVFASQTAYIEKVAKAHCIKDENVRRYKTPMGPKFNIWPEDLPDPEDVDPSLSRRPRACLAASCFLLDGVAPTSPF